MKLWPDQFVNKKVQEHDEQIAALEARLAKLEAKRKPGPKPKAKTLKVGPGTLTVKS